MIELERTFLAKKIPDLSNCKGIEIIDVYIPKNREHPTLRIRKFGDMFELTKKEPLKDASVQKEQTIPLSKEEFEELSGLVGKRTEKVRFYFEHGGRKAEIDIFKGDLEGLVLVDFEFENEREKDSFVMPGFCLVDVTHEEFVAGGMLCGKKYSDIENDLRKFGYERLV